MALGQWGLKTWKSVRVLERRCAAGHASVSGLWPGDASGCAATLNDFRVFDLVFGFRFGKSKLAFRIFAFFKFTSLSEQEPCRPSARCSYPGILATCIFFLRERHVRRTFCLRVCGYKRFLPFSRIPFGDHPLKLERYRED